MDATGMRIGGKRAAGTVATLRRVLERAPAPRTAEKCEMCAKPIAPDHPHLVHLEQRNLLCVCRPCALLFENPGAAGGKYRRVPDRRLRDPAFRLGEAEWETLRIPVRTAFFFRNSTLDRVVAFYPSPAGATESLLEIDSWRSLAERTPLLDDLAPDVEALLVHAPRGGAFESYVVPITDCYELTGLVRQRWRGFDGGEDVHRAIAGFFSTLRERSREIRR
jgi:hypothetical protein